ncbi:fha domain [Pyrenophora seminiperda CCB06]|uniref:Fha domain n=1 Tax=Pyrenophora seminiperda CCB06 TaxID=1302712 RepID=A0A3M7MHG6_9PLEO|nr:fha domain [Pyrenophora seminiperda CCB06]
MASSEPPALPPLMILIRLADFPVFHIVLRDPKRYDTYATREFDLPLSATFPVGRASTNASKKELMAAPHNAYIDSPVISRQHAILSANSNNDLPSVYITDQGSMHGTWLNGQRLPAHTPTKLSYGDELQFGTDVNRNEGTFLYSTSISSLTSHIIPTLNATEFFVARTYVFESRFTRPFCTGFTVPDPESEEENITDRRGSMEDPFLIDSSSSSSGQPEEGEQADVTIAIDMDRVTTERYQCPNPKETVNAHDALTTTYSPSSHPPSEAEGDLGSSVESFGRKNLAPHASSDAEADDSPESDLDSEVGSIDYIDYPELAEFYEELEPELMDSEDEDMEETDSPRPMSSNMQGEPVPSTTPLISSHRCISSSDGAAQAQESLPRLALLASQRFESHSMTNNPSLGSMSSNDEAAPPLPPRPITRTAPWNEPRFPNFAQQNVYTGFNFEEMPHSNYIGTNFGDRPAMFNPAPPPTSEYMQPRSTTPTFSIYPRHPVHMFDRLPSPPPMPTSDLENSVPLQPGRRTKVSIEEIVEEIVEDVVEDVVEKQPPTPESTSSLKRKADVLEEEEPPAMTEVVKETAVATEQAPTDDTSGDATAIRAVVAIAQRPKKTPRSVLSRVLNKAAYPLLGATGAVVSFALLSTLPDTFFL